AGSCRLRTTAECGSRLSRKSSPARDSSAARTERRACADPSVRYRDEPGSRAPGACSQATRENALRSYQLPLLPLVAGPKDFDRRRACDRGSRGRRRNGERRDLIQKVSTGANRLDWPGQVPCRNQKPSWPLGFCAFFPVQYAAIVTSRGAPWISSKPSKSRSKTTRCCCT